MSLDAAVLAALRTLLRSSHFSGPDALPSLARDAGAEIGAQVSRIYHVDYGQVSLVPLIGPDEDVAIEPLRIDGTLAGRAYSDVAQHVRRADGAVTLWTPLLDGTERLGVWELRFPSGTELADDLLSGCRDVASLLAEIGLTRALYGDLVECARRREPLTVPAELQWRMMPPLTFVSERVAIAGIFAPATRVAGDSFDYAVNGSRAHVAVIDAMGHGLEAALLAAVAISTLRNGRRHGFDLAGVAALIDEMIGVQFGPDKFVTAIIGELDLPSGRWRWINCGHPAALLVRNARVVKTLDAVTAPPLGLGILAQDMPIGEEALEPGDRLLLYTDGVVEARDAAGQFFGTDRLVGLVTRETAAGRPVPETLRRLNRAILAHQQGELQDDATTVVIEWVTSETRRATVDRAGG